jgi:mRNA interferase RelE/StbE
MPLVRKLEITEEALEFVRNLEPKQFKQVMNKILSLLSDPAQSDSILMKGSTDLHRTDIGEHRIVYQFDDKVVATFVVGKRNDDDAYKKAKRKRL